MNWVAGTRRVWRWAKVADRCVDACVRRKTAETEIEVHLALRRPGEVRVETGIPMFDHLISTFGFHGGFELDISCRAGTFFSQHHIVEDTGIALGRALSELIGDGAGIRRFGWAAVPMDDALVLASADLCGRVGFRSDLPLRGAVTDGFECGLAVEFFKALCANGRLVIHLKYFWGDDSHHVLEAAFKAAALAISSALEKGADRVPSVKGEL